jgi:3-oxoacyl-[acyl-carrier-protein] synthase II
MAAIAIVAFGAVSAMGEGRAAAHAGSPGSPATVSIERDLELEAAGLGRPFAARVRSSGEDDDAAGILWRALTRCAGKLDEARTGWRGDRVGLVLGTACGGMRAAQRAFETLERGGRIVDIEAPTYFGPMAHASRRLGLAFDPSLLVLGACASSTLAIGLAMRFLERDACDIVLAGGFDDVTDFVAAGFESLRAISASGHPCPFRLDRDGMALGEGAAVLALARAKSEAVLLRGFGAASDAVHLTAPDREGRALGRAAIAALDEAGQPSIDLVSAHATATPMNDVAEFAAMVQALGADEARDVVVHPFKAQIGHTMGAAGALELLACVDAIERSVRPAAAGRGDTDPAAPARLLDLTLAEPTRTALKLSSAFGGCNAAIVVGTDATAARSATGRRTRSVFVHDAVYVEREPKPEALAESCHLQLERIARSDGLVRLALGAVARLREACGSLGGAGVVVGTALGTVETNAIFAGRLRARGAARVEPRRFPYTSPNAVAGECSIAFGLTGPSFSTGGGMHAALEAFAAAAVLIEAGDAERMVVVAVDEVGPVAGALAPPGVGLRSGAVAVLLTALETTESGRRARARVGAVTLKRGQPVSVTLPAGHRALLPLAVGGAVADISGASPPDVFARIAFEAL